MKLVVIIPTWKRDEKLKNALESLERQIQLPDHVIST